LENFKNKLIDKKLSLEQENIEWNTNSHILIYL
jgi:hypothetical protein